VQSPLTFKHITKEYGAGVFSKSRVTALNDFSLEVRAGEIFGFLGPNGAGKTTAIHIALGLAFATSGVGSIMGHAFGLAAGRKRVGFLAENVALYHRPAADLLRFYGALNGVAGLSLSQRTAELLRELDLFEVRSRNVGKFSRGMLQRVGLAQAFINDPDLLILDEPTSALDPAARVLVRELLLDARSRGKTIFLSSHLLSEVEVICDRVAIISRGKLKRLASTRELLEAQGQCEIVARGIHPQLFGGEPRNGMVHIRASASDQRGLIESIWNAGGEIVSVNPARADLEQLFLAETQERSQ
jgi:ABC-2 type transport system ATP-binding protein